MTAIEKFWNRYAEKPNFKEMLIVREKDGELIYRIVGNGEISQFTDYYSIICYLNVSNLGIDLKHRRRFNFFNSPSCEYDLYSGPETPVCELPVMFK